MIKPKLVTRDEMKIIGVEARTINRAEADPLTAKIPGLCDSAERKRAEALQNSGANLFDLALGHLRNLRNLRIKNKYPIKDD